MKYARCLRVAGYVFGGALVGVVTSLILLFSLIELDVFGKYRGIGWPVVQILLIAVFYAGGLLVGLLGGLLIALRTGQPLPSHDSDSHFLLKQLLADVGAQPNGRNPAEGS